MNTMPISSVSPTAPASGLKTTNAPAASERSPLSNAPKNGPVPCIENEPMKVSAPANSSVQPTSSVATSVDAIGKTTAAMPSTVIARPSQSSRPEAPRMRPWKSVSVCVSVMADSSMNDLYEQSTHSSQFQKCHSRVGGNPLLPSRPVTGCPPSRA